MHPQGFSRDDNHDAVLKVKSSVLLQKLHSTSRESEALKGAMHTQPSYSDRPKFEFLESRAGAIDLWRQLISRYTERSLTKIQDRLIAISAVVKEFQPLIQATYLAGMWQCELETGLLVSSPDQRRLSITILPYLTFQCVVVPPEVCK